VNRPPTSSPVVAAAGLRKRFGRRGRWVLTDVDLTVGPGSLTVVSGGNGSGKTTLLRLLSGLSRPSAGQIVARPTTVGFVPDRLPSRMRMSAAQYVQHMGRIRGLDPATIATRAGQLFEALALSPGADVGIASLSKGNCQKVTLVQALLSPVALLALDEPFSALDEPARCALRELLAEARAAGAAVVVTAHGRAELPTADLVIELVGGRVVGQPGPPSSAARSEPLVTVELLAPDGDVAVAPLANFVARPTGDSSIIDHRLTIVVARSVVDRLLVAALGAGWSVLAVSPRDPAPPDPGP